MKITLINRSKHSDEEIYTLLIMYVSIRNVRTTLREFLSTHKILNRTYYFNMCRWDRFHVFSQSFTHNKLDVFFYNSQFLSQIQKNDPKFYEAAENIQNTVGFETFMDELTTLYTQWNAIHSLAKFFRDKKDSLPSPDDIDFSIILEFK